MRKSHNLYFATQNVVTEVSIMPDPSVSFPAAAIFLASKPELVQ